MKNLMSNQEIRERYESGTFLSSKQIDQIQYDLEQSANTEGRDENDPEFINDFWANYCPEDDGNKFVRVDKF